MSDTVKLDEGVSQEVNAANIFAGLGFFTRCHIQIFPTQQTDEISDIDVLAVRFDAHLFSETALVEAKRHSSKISDIFRLFGFKTYFGASNAFFLSTDIHGMPSEIAKKLGIRPLQFKRFSELVQKDKRRVFEPWKTEHVKQTLYCLRTVRDTVDKELFWEFHYLWLERDPYERFYGYQRLFERSIQHLDKPKPIPQVLAWYRRELFVLSFLALVEIASDCVDLQIDGVQEYVENKFANSGIRKESKVKIKRGVDKLLNIIQKTSTARVEIPQLDVLPAYTVQLVELIQMTLRGAPFAHSYLITNDNLHRKISGGEEINIKDFTDEKAYLFLRAFNEKLLRILHGGPLRPDFNNFI